MMTKEGWLACVSPYLMVEFLRGKASQRKLRLVACACCRRISHLLTPQNCHDLEIGEQLAEGLLPLDSPAWIDPKRRNYGTGPVDAPTGACLSTRVMDPFLAAFAAAMKASDAVADVSTPSKEYMARLEYKTSEQKAQADLVRDVFGHIFFTGMVEPAWLQWNEGAVPRLARTIYEERRFGNVLDLYDVLLDAGCNNQDILSHLRVPGPHVRGCWVLDLILGWE
jgi:hypothetical protein